MFNKYNPVKNIVKMIIDFSEDNTSGLIMSKSSIKRSVKKMLNNEPIDLKATKHGFLVKESDFDLALTMEAIKETNS